VSINSGLLCFGIPFADRDDLVLPESPHFVVFDAGDRRPGHASRVMGCDVDALVIKRQDDLIKI
jgi:hypothetical protein